MIRWSPPSILGLAAVLLAAVALGPNGGADAREAEDLATGCDLRFASDLAFDGAAAPAHRLVASIEGPDCLGAGVLWRVYAPDGRLIWAEATQHTDLIAPGGGGETPVDRAGVEMIYAGKALDQSVFSMADMPVWPAAQSAAPAFDFMTEDDLWAETRVGPEIWNQAVAEGWPAWCWFPGSHWARCFWLTPKTPRDGVTEPRRLREAFVMAW